MAEQKIIDNLRGKWGRNKCISTTKKKKTQTMV